MIQWVLLIAVFIWLAVLTYYLYKTDFHYKKLVKGANNEDLRKILDKILDELNLNKKTLDNLDAGLQKQIDKSINYVQKVGIVRFNPFADTGSDQSFVLAILDGTDSGMVLTSLHSRTNTRWYAKNVEKGKGIDHQLSAEEEKAVKAARLLQKEK